MPITFVPYSETNIEHNTPESSISEWQSENSKHELSWHYEFQGGYRPHWYWWWIRVELEDYLRDYTGPQCECCREAPES